MIWTHCTGEPKSDVVNSIPLEHSNVSLCFGHFNPTSEHNNMLRLFNQKIQDQNWDENKP